MNKNLLIGIVIGVVIAGGVFYFVSKKVNPMEERSEGMTASQEKVIPSGTQKRGPGQGFFSMKGQKLSDSNIAQFAYKIFPGTISADAKAAMVGFNMSTQTMPDGSTQVTFDPTETGYTKQQYTVKSDQSLYYIERNKGDDTKDTDLNQRDDFAVVVDQNGVIQ